MSVTYHALAPIFPQKSNTASFSPKGKLLITEAQCLPRSCLSYPIAADRVVEEVYPMEPRGVAQKCTRAAVEAEAPGYCAAKE